MDVCFQAPPSRVATADLVNFAGFATNASTVNVTPFVDVRCYLAVRKAAIRGRTDAKSIWVGCREVEEGNAFAIDQGRSLENSAPAAT